MSKNEEKVPLNGMKNSTTESASRASTNLQSQGEETSLMAESRQHSVVIKSEDGKFHKVIFDRVRGSIEFTLLRASQQPTDKFLTISLQYVLAVRCSSINFSAKNGLPISVPEDDSMNSSRLHLFIYYTYRSNVYTRRLREIMLKFMTSSERDEWYTLLSEAIKVLPNRPKQLIVFVNPFGGKGKASSIWEKQVEPFFKLTGVEYYLIKTERANHAKDLITGLDADKWDSIDGFISVGGDGLFNEVLSSTIIRSQISDGKNIDDRNIKELTIPRMRFGIIGAGSANSIVASVHGVDDCPTAAIHIAIGSKCSVDVCTVHAENRLLRLSANAISYGWLGDTLHHSERYRFMGPIRYQWSALWTSIRHPTYRGRVSFALSQPPHQIANENTEAAADNVSLHQHPSRKLPQCTGQCVICDGNDIDEQYPYHLQSDFTHVICCINRCISPFTPFGLAPFAELNDGSMDLALIPMVSRLQNLRIMSKVALYGGRFLAKSERDLNVYRVSRWKFTPNSLLSLSTGRQNGTPGQTSEEQTGAFDAVESKNELDDEQEGAWNLDGEIVQQPVRKCLYFRLHPHLINYFGSPNVDLDDPRYQKCWPCCFGRSSNQYSSIIIYD